MRPEAQDRPRGIYTGLHQGSEGVDGWLRPVLRGRRRGNAPPLPDWRVWFVVLEEAGLAVQLVNSSQARNLPGRPKTDKEDARWIARLTEMGMLRSSFVPPPEIRALRVYTRHIWDLTADRTRYWQRLEKLLEDAQLTELRERMAVSGRSAGARAARFPACDQRRGWRAGSVVAEGAALRGG